MTRTPAPTPRKLDVALGVVTSIYVLALLVALAAAMFAGFPWRDFAAVAFYGLIAWLLLAMLAAILVGPSAEAQRRPRGDDR